VTFRQSNFAYVERPQKTIKRAVSYSGIGIHSGKWVTLTLSPAEENTGILFQRSDLKECPLIPATVEFTIDTRRCTVIGKKGFNIGTIEHLLAALKAYQVDNVIVKVSDQELPIGDGSSRPFAMLLDEAGIETQRDTVPILKLQQPLYWSDGQRYLMALPYDGLRFSYSLHYPNSPILQNQFASHLLTQEEFQNEIAPCRTFACMEEVKPLMEKGLIKGGSLENTVVVQDNVVLNQGGTRFENEMARHKVLDMIGDLCLAGIDFQAHILGHRTGHQANNYLANEIRKALKSEELQCQST